MNNALTWVTLQRFRGRAHAYLRFGRPAEQQPVDAQQTIAGFMPDSIFCRVRWERVTTSTLSWQASVMQAVTETSGACRVEGVTPGALVLLNAEGDGVHALLALIDGMETQGIDPCAVPADTWRSVATGPILNARLPRWNAR